MLNKVLICGLNGVGKKTLLSDILNNSNNENVLEIENKYYSAKISFSILEINNIEKEKENYEEIQALILVYKNSKKNTIDDLIEWFNQNNQIFQLKTILCIGNHFENESVFSLDDKYIDYFIDNNIEHLSFDFINQNKKEENSQTKSLLNDQHEPNEEYANIGRLIECLETTQWNEMEMKDFRKKNRIKSNEINLNEINSNEINLNEFELNEKNLNEIKSNEIKSNEINSNEINSNEINSNEIKSNEINSNEINSNEIKSNEIKSNEIKSNEINSNEINSNEKNSNEINSNEKNSNEINSNEINSNELLNQNLQFESNFAEDVNDIDEFFREEFLKKNTEKKSIAEEDMEKQFDEFEKIMSDVLRFKELDKQMDFKTRQENATKIILELSKMMGFSDDDLDDDLDDLDDDQNQNQNQNKN
ncbi:alpha- and gamma-adaptin-binding protein p34 [Anaeramoeba ignava]|uniref:Alpha- and gamma-adaptin-binding protein p34 n=1 Tax=Anaeramoeba ignava TaxID=1746090 RepID=A0A9Q0R7V5_ANAIG|nr:alpha- and gamma-adaptin-binding protein p34 [Anaeramoeba ignava]